MTIIDYEEDFQNKADQLGKKYDIARGKVYDMMLGIKNVLRIKRPNDYKNNKDVFYRKTYLIAEKRLQLQQQPKLQPQSDLERISNEMNQR
jgi:hypothetical protein